MILAAAIMFFGEMLVAVLTDLDEVVVASLALLHICAVYVIASFPAFQLDGVFIGASRTKEMRNASFVSLLVFLLAVWVLTETYALAGLWWAMVVFVVARAISLWVYVPRFWNHFARDDEVTV